MALFPIQPRNKMKDMGHFPCFFPKKTIKLIPNLCIYSPNRLKNVFQNIISNSIYLTNN